MGGSVMPWLVTAQTPALNDVTGGGGTVGDQTVDQCVPCVLGGPVPIWTE